MASIAIDRVNARYRLPLSAVGEQRRVQRIVDAALEQMLEGAIERQGIGREGYVCIRDLRAVVNVRLREPDSALASGVGDAIAVALRRLIDERSPLVVEYGTRAHALVDLASSALSGDFTRSWAWAQVGIWCADFPLGADVTADLIVRALAKEPTHAVAVAAHLARERTDRFHGLVARATSTSWAALERAVMAAARITPPSTRQAGADGIARELIDGAREMQALAPIARRTVSHSAIARACVERFTAAPAETRGALSALILLEAEPSAARREDLPRLLKTIEQVMALTAAPASARRLDLQPISEVDEALSAADTSSRHDAEAARSSRGDLPRRPGARTRADDRTDSTPHDNDSHAADSAGDTLPDVRAVVRTQNGGLLYLVNLLSRMGLVETITTDPRWSDRGLRWVLHQLATRLAAAEPDDPATLVFAGLAPPTPPPSSRQEPPTDLERAALDALREAIVHALRDALGDPSDGARASDEHLLIGVCARPARIVAEPGWIEARFSLEDVSLDIRRAGLDCHPDWVPWLGIVLRFAYA